MNDAIEKFWKAYAAGREAVRRSRGNDGVDDDHWRLLPTIVIVVLVLVLWHWLHWYAAILIAVGVGIIVQAIMVAVAKRGRASAESAHESGSQENL